MDRDLRKAFKLAEKGDEKQIMFLAYEVFDGSREGRIPASSQEARQIISWVTELVKENNYEAMFWSALLLHSQQNYENAANAFLKVLEKSIADNHPNAVACAHVAYYYYYGYGGLEKDLNTAETYAKYAINFGEEKISNWVMGMLCIEKMKTDFSKNWLDEAKKYFKISAKNGYSSSKKAMKEVFGEIIY